MFQVQRCRSFPALNIELGTRTAPARSYRWMYITAAILCGMSPALTAKNWTILK